MAIKQFLKLPTTLLYYKAFRCSMFLVLKYSAKAKSRSRSWKYAEMMAESVALRAHVSRLFEMFSSFSREWSEKAESTLVNVFLFHIISDSAEDRESSRKERDINFCAIHQGLAFSFQCMRLGSY